MLDALFPAVCLGCRRLVQDDGTLPLCGRCRLAHQELAVPPAHRDGALLSYEGPARAALHRLKYGREIAWAGPLGRALAAAPHFDGAFDFIIPVPLHRVRMWGRGFNQTWLLLQAAARVHGTPTRRRLEANVLRRHRRTQPQATLAAAARWANVRGAFRVGGRRAGALRGARVLLVDDVATTGATLRAAAAPLTRAGAHVVSLALMRAAS